MILKLKNTEFYEGIELNYAKITKYYENSHIICNILKQDQNGELVQFSNHRIFCQADNNLDLGGLTIAQFIEQNPLNGQQSDQRVQYEQYTEQLTEQNTQNTEQL